MVWTQPLDLQYLLVNTFSGSIEIFSFISFIALAGLAAYFRMPNVITLLMFVLFSLFMSTYLGGLYVIILLLAGLITFFSLSKIFKG